nr:hypothetical protein [Acidobacteriota bacterium]
MKSTSVLTLVLILLPISAVVGQSVAAQKVSPEASRMAEKAQAFELAGDWPAAEQAYVKAIELAPFWAEALVNLAALYN